MSAGRIEQREPHFIGALLRLDDVSIAYRAGARAEREYLIEQVAQRLWRHAFIGALRDPQGWWRPLLPDARAQEASAIYDLLRGAP